MKLSKQWFFKITICVIFVCITLYLFKLGVNTQAGLDLIKQPHNWLRTTVESHFYISYLAFIILSIGLAVISFPVVVFCTILGGYLFGIIDGFIANYLIDVTGAIGAYWVNRYIYGDIKFANAPKRLQALQKSLANGTVWYLLIIRIFGIVPYVLVNILCGVIKFNFKMFSLITAIGLIPLTLFYTTLGHSMAVALDHHKTPISFATSQMLCYALIGFLIILLMRLIVIFIMKRQAR